MRTAIEHAVAARVIGHTVIAKKMPTRTLHLSLFTWLDFDSYDDQRRLGGIPLGSSLGSSLGGSLGIPQGTVIHNGSTQLCNIPSENTSRNTRREDLTVAAPPLLPLPGAGASAGENDLDEEGEEVDEDAGQVATCSAERQSFDPINGLTPKDMVRILTSHESVRDWLLYGMSGVLEADEEKRKQLPPTIWNWRVHVIDFQSKIATEEGLGLKNWGVQQFVGFYWYRVSFWRNERGIAQTLPDFGKLCGIVKNLMQQHTLWQMYLMLNNITQHFDILCCMVGNAGQVMWLDDTTLCNSLIRGALSKYLDGNHQQQVRYYEMHAEGLQQRIQRYQR